MTYKRNTVSILAQKILELSDTEFHEANFNLLRKTLFDNGYPKKLVNDLIRHTKNKHQHDHYDNQQHKESKDLSNMVAIP